MELIDDWTAEHNRARPPQTALATAAPAASSPTALAMAIGAALTGFQPQIVTVHCYSDVGYPWVQVTFEKTIDPVVALRVGDSIAGAAGKENVYFNSLRPRAVYFVLEPAFAPKPDLPAHRYGTRLDEIRRVWRSAPRE